MATMVKSFSVEGIDGFLVEIKATTIHGQQMMSIIGLGDQAVKESGERIQAAIEHVGYEVPKEKIIMSLAPGDRRKRGSHYDLGMAVSLLQQLDQIAAKQLEQYGFIGELSLNGKLRPCNGILPMVAEAKRVGLRKIIVPVSNRQEAQMIHDMEIYGMDNLKQVIRFLEGKNVSDIKIARFLPP